MPEQRAAAVVMAIFADPPYHVIFVERAAHLRNHPGQNAFPGGAVDAADGDDPATTALRELHEELGVPPGRVAIVGRLPAIEQRFNRFIVTPLVGILEPHTLLTIDHTETAAVFTIPLAEIVAPGAVHEGVEIIGEQQFPTNILDYEGHHIWGLTAGILRAFVDTWNAPEAPLRGAIEGRLRR